VQKREAKTTVFSMQCHPEASLGPRDSAYLFDRFAELVRAA